MINRIYNLIIAALLTSILTGCGDYELLSQDELARRDAKVRQETTKQVETRMTNEFARQETRIKEKARRELMAELEAAHKPTAPPENNLRNTRWGMSQEEVISAEGRNHLQRNDTTLLYKDYTAGLPSIIRYLFEGGRLVKAEIHFSNPKLSKVLPLRSSTLVEADFFRMYDLLSEKYGSAQITTQQISRIENLLRKQERLNDSLVQYQRQRNDLQRDYDRQRAELWKKYEGWRDREFQVQKHLKDKESQARRLDDWIVEIKRQQADIEPIIREEQYNERDGKLPHTTVCRWYEPSSFDITLSWFSSPQGSILYSKYNGFITPNLSAAPSDF